MKWIKTRTYYPRALFRILHCGILLRVVGVVLLVGLVGSAIPSAIAQQERPQIMPGERKAARKKDAGPRALGIVQLGKHGKASIIPVAILVNGKFWDASAYKADPVPMALDSGVVYEGVRSGSSLGLFTVGSALHSNNPGAAIPWLGTGVWRANGTEPPAPAKKAESAPAGISTDDAPPKLTRDPSANKPAAPASTNPPASQPSQPSSGSGDGPPRLTKGTSPGSDSSQQSTPAGASAPASSNPPPAQPSKPSSGPDDGPPRLNRGNSSPGSDSGSSQDTSAGRSKPSDSKSGDSKTSDTSPPQTKSGDQAKDKGPVATSDSGAGEANRPRLRRGKPAESFADEDIPGYSLPGVRPKSSQDAGKVVQTAAPNKEDVQLIPAVSDAADSGREPKSFAFEWIPGEEADRRKQMVDLAKDQLRNYIEARAKNSIAANETHSTPAKKVVTTKPPVPDLENMQMVAYDLWGSNQPVLVLSAQAQAQPTSTTTQADPGLQYSIVLVAYPDIYHNLHKMYVGITDKFHLDVTPRLELIDAVDADGDGRGELLFRETSDQGSGWVVYRAGADKLVKAFDSLNPE